MINFDNKANYSFEDLVQIVKLLRAPGGCPWDREQTHASIRRNFIEEACEACEAIDKRDDENLCEELGDVLLQVVFHTVMAQEDGSFTIDDVTGRVCRKLIHRHPHVFGDVAVEGTGQVLENWDQIKRREKGQSTHTEAMRSVAKSLPALWRAEKIQSKAKKAGFDWPDVSGALDKLSEEVGELKEAQNRGQAAEELGDVLFSAVNVARFLDLDPEEALGRACDKFISRFEKVEGMAGQAMADMSLKALDELWGKAKE